MSSFKNRSDYFKMICAKNKLIAHNQEIAGNGTRRNSFFRINDESELATAVKNWIHFPCVVHTGFNLNFRQPETGMPRMVITNNLSFLTPTNRDTFVYENDAIEAAYNETLTAMMQFLSYMRNDREENGSCGNLFLFDLNRAKATQEGPINSVLYGWNLQFVDEEKATEMEYDEALWQEVGSGGGGGGGNGDGVENFTDVVYELIDGVPTFTFSGGNLVGSTEINIETFGENYNTIAEGVTVANISVNLGTHYIKWRRKVGNSRTEWSATVAFTIVNTGTFTMRLINVITLEENAIQFPVYVAQVTTHLGGLDTKINSNQIANNETEFITIWNSINSANSIITEGLYHVYSPYFASWEFTADGLDNIQRPTAAWCYSI